MKKALFYFLLFLISNLGFSQQQKYIPGEVLVKLQKDYSSKSFLQDFRKSSTQLSNPVLVSKSLNIWKYSFDSNAVKMEDVLKSVSRNKNTLIVQVNHIIEKRATMPDDTRYDRQWQYFQENDKDIDADEAWDITTGGTTANGHEIVVAVIDDGIQFDHPDLQGNIWMNSQEIAGNNIDDDGNGYVDDVKGWNTATNDDNVGDLGHGTPVSGIIGAKGNNNLGVAGVNWDVKIMAIDGGTGVEEEVIRAYSYILDNRKLYNETNGEKGAFVVATNASWGVDFGQPEDAPLWCALYDELGQHGILNAGATINDNQNIDIVGDLPTACPSDFLISVTNMNQDDEKVRFAGFGKTTIDLGAHGENAYTITSGSGYGGFGGTSGATPHVAGAIALLYAAPSNTFAELAISNPKEAAMKVRGYILDNVDPNTSLEDITTTGGRLNLFKSLQALMNDQVLSIDDLPSQSNHEFLLYPNPAQDIVQFKTNSDIKIKSVSVYTTTGKLANKFNDVTSSMDVSDLSSGLYIVRYEVASTNSLYHTMLLKR
ncbi:T9SS C-terminal target domain-containing protein [Aquimarina sp. BL5]|uniref:S8 family peptidase n=1 Tax=Aquimarina sp. BL5 TaxID=1714860 RepID=UPI000E478ED5|nr:S8 family peptidase [Aquimarina sp. BL5]AXT49403.1 T9SS C-terminal target domain-containing protein [Aquimarina sp. BL5]RKN07979.1 T9SS C-terminal target domain-containing protein [Aquimarina sp. BL5]